MIILGSAADRPEKEKEDKRQPYTDSPEKPLFRGGIYLINGKIGKVLLRVVGIGNPEARELIELMYEFEEPLILDGERFRALFPSFTFTPHEEAIQKTLEWFQNRSVQSFRRS